jgi:chromosome segregation protein
MSKQSQFILITHNKRTMEVVDTLYGVTMEEPGISKLVSVRLREAAAANDDQAVA